MWVYFLRFTVSGRYAGALFADACLKGLNGVPDVVECSFVQSTVTELPFFASKVGHVLFWLLFPWTILFDCRHATSEAELLVFLYNWNPPAAWILFHFDFPLLTGEAWKEWSRVCFGFGSSLRLWERRFGKAQARAQSFHRERNPVCKCKLEDVCIIYSRDRYICCPHYHKTQSIFAFPNPIVTDDAAYAQSALLFFVRVDHFLSYKFYQ